MTWRTEVVEGLIVNGLPIVWGRQPRGGCHDSDVTGIFWGLHGRAIVSTSLDEVVATLRTLEPALIDPARVLAR